MKKIKLFLGIIALTLVMVAPKAVYAKDEPKEARQCTFVIPSDFTPEPESGVFVNKNEPMESSSICYDVYDNGKNLVLTNREKKKNPASIEKAIVDNSGNLTKSEYEKILSESYKKALGQDVNFTVTSFKDITIDGYPGYKIESTFTVSKQQPVYQTVYMILSKYKTFTITYQRAEDDLCEELFETSAATIHVK